MITGEAALTRWLVEHAREFFPEVLGGFGAYFLHELYQHMFRRPGRSLLRLLFGKRGRA